MELQSISSRLRRIWPFQSLHSQIAETAAAVAAGRHIAVGLEDPPKWLEPHGVTVPRPSYLGWFHIARQLSQDPDTDLLFLDGKCDRVIHRHLANFARGNGRTFRSCLTEPGDPFDAWRGNWRQVMARLLEVFDFAEAERSTYHHEVAALVTQLACRQPDGPPRDSEELLRRLDHDRLTAVHGRDMHCISARQLTHVRIWYRGFFATMPGGLDGIWSWEDTELGYACPYRESVDDRLGRTVDNWLVRDLVDHLKWRRDPDRTCVVFLNLQPAQVNLSRLLEVARSKGVGVVLLPEASVLLSRPAGSQMPTYLRPQMAHAAA
jgi:hypothetical protein